MPAEGRRAAEVPWTSLWSLPKLLFGPTSAPRQVNMQNDLLFQFPKNLAARSCWLAAKLSWKFGHGSALLAQGSSKIWRTWLQHMSFRVQGLQASACKTWLQNLSDDLSMMWRLRANIRKVPRKQKSTALGDFVSRSLLRWCERATMAWYDQECETGKSHGARPLKQCHALASPQIRGLRQELWRGTDSIKKSEDVKSNFWPRPLRSPNNNPPLQCQI